MGIDLKHPVVALSNDAFRRLDYRVMAMAFELHNEIGNLWDEEEYQLKLFDRCLNEGMDATKESPVTVSHRGFAKTYFMDLLIEGAVYELKTAAGIAEAHQSQTLNYLFLTNTQHGKIINFRPDSLQWRFISTTLTSKERKSYSLNTGKWIPRTQVHTTLPDLLAELLDEWGAYLDLQIYREALFFFMGISPEETKKRFYVLSPDTLFHITGLTRNKSFYAENLYKYLRASPMQYIDWINFDQNRVELITLGNQSFCH